MGETRLLHCARCLTSRTGDELGAPCRTPGCAGRIEELPPFDTLVDRLPEPVVCPRRTIKFPAVETFPGPDYWQQFKRNGDRICSFCGSLHPEDFLRLVHESAVAAPDAAYGSVVEIEFSSQPYKIYVRRPDVRNAMEGGIKFYTAHLRGLVVSFEAHRDFSSAVYATRKRFERQMRLLRMHPSGAPN